MLLASLVACSFVGAPAVAATGSDDTSIGDGVDDAVGSDGSSTDGSDDEESTDDSSGDDSTDGSTENDTGETFELIETTTDTAGVDEELDLQLEDASETGGTGIATAGSDSRLWPRRPAGTSGGAGSGAAPVRSGWEIPDTGAGADDGAALSTGGGGGQPLPAGASGGAALGLGVLAAAAAVRSTPLVAASTGSGTGSTGLLSALLDEVKPFVFPLRYSRYDDSDPLEHDARERVYEIVNETPGTYLSEVSEQAGLPLSTTRHHMKVLEREDLVSGAKLRGKRRFYPAYADGIELAAALNDDSTASIIDALARLGASSVSDLADDLGRDPSTISHHLQRLDGDGIITREREGRAVMNELSAEARTALEPETTPRPGEAAEALAD
ncbi:hypothetical protein BRC63_10670 [Halobacteriales archaeon QH_10_70_21]|nr:MAG: hypothetical protein BRC63_10670 [Halobacteriales archaeon QH_10_70_21]